MEENLSNYNASNIIDARKIQSAKTLEILIDEVMLEPHLFYQVIKTVNVILGWVKLSANSQIHKHRVFMFKQLQRALKFMWESESTTRS